MPTLFASIPITIGTKALRANAPHVSQIQAGNDIRIVKYYKKQLCRVKILNL